MEQYAGTPQQIDLQRKADQYAEWMYSTKGACHTGRFIGTDDPDALGWQTIFDHLATDGALGFRLMPVEKLAAIETTLAEKGYHIDYWDVFAGIADDVMSTTQKFADEPLPDGLHLIGSDSICQQDTIARIQDFMVANGIAPFSGKMLSGALAPSCLIAVENETGAIVATAFCYFSHNKFSANQFNAWGGLIAVDESQRGKRLGVWVNTKMVRDSIETLNAQQIYELVSATNIPSRKMVERCGLQLDPTVKCGIATASNKRFTT